VFGIKDTVDSRKQLLILEIPIKSIMEIAISLNPKFQLECALRLGSA